MAFGLAIKKLREDAGISVDRLTAKIGVSAARWRKWEEKDYDPRDEDRARIEKFFGMPLNEIGNLDTIVNFLNVPNRRFVDMKHEEELSIEKALRREREAIDRERKALEMDKAFLQKIIDSNLTLALASLKTISIRQEAAGEVVLGSLARIEGKEESELIEAADKRRAQIEKEWQTHGSGADASRSHKENRIP